MKDVVTGVVRHILTFGGGFATSAGLASADEIAAIIGGVVTLVGVVWSALSKKKED